MLSLLLPVLLAASEPTPEAWHLSEPLCCTTDYQRRAVVGTGDLPAGEITIEAQPAGLLTATVTALDAGRVEIHLQAKRSGQGSIALLDAGRTVRLRRTVQVVSMTTDCEKHISTEYSLPDGTAVFKGQLILSPHVAGLDVRFACLSNQVTVPDGLSERWIASETFTPSPSGDSSETSFRMVRQPGGRWVPFSYILYQDGEQIGAP
jgi:hypothetical protein